MKAAICYQFGQPLVVEEVELAPPQTGEVEVKLAACAICHSDILYMDGAWGGKLPAIYGHEAAGIVTKTGPGVKTVQVGNHVVVSLIRSCGRCVYCRQGQPFLCRAAFAIDTTGRLQTTGGRAIHQGLRTAAFAEYVVVDESQVVPIPEQVSLVSASLLACGVITGLGAVTHTARLTAGNSVAVIGAGGVGLNSIQGAALSGAHPIIAIDLLDNKLEAARLFGATHTVNPARENAPEVVYALTQNQGVDYVFATVGNPSALEQAMALLRRGGTLVAVGIPASGTKMQIEIADFVDNSQHIVGSKMGSTRPHVDIPKLAELYLHGRLKLDELITAHYPLEEINRAITEVKQGAALRNVIVF